MVSKVAYVRKFVREIIGDFAELLFVASIVAFLVFVTHLSVVVGIVLFATVAVVGIFCFVAVLLRTMSEYKRDQAKQALEDARIQEGQRFADETEQWLAHRSRDTPSE